MLHSIQAEMMEILKQSARTVLRPLRGPVSWAGQHGYLPRAFRKVLPYRWAIEPFTIYGEGWSCKWRPVEFDSIGRKVFWTGLRDWEQETVPVILNEIRRASCFLDIGANCGIYSVLGCTVNPGLRVIAVEPVPKTFAALKGNIGENHLEGRITAVNCALGESNGVVDFHEAADATMCSMATTGYRGQAGRVIQVQCRTLDSLVSELNAAPDFMKIDVEGFEHVVLGGARNVLAKFRPRIVLEANPGDPADLVSSILSQQRYTFQLLTNQGLVSKPEIVPDPEYRNWLCIPETTRQ